jgi:hypothetical protein
LNKIIKKAVRRVTGRFFRAVAKAAMQAARA